MTLCMKGKGFGVNLVARELALVLADGAFRPEVVKHISGASNVVADILSRSFQPDKELSCLRFSERSKNSIHHLEMPRTIVQFQDCPQSRAGRLGKTRNCLATIINSLMSI